MSREQAPKMHRRTIGATRGSQGGYRAAQRGIGADLAQWARVIGAVEVSTPNEVAQSRYIDRQLDVNSRATQTY